MSPQAGAALPRARRRGHGRDRLGAATSADADAHLPAPALRGRAGRGDRRPGVRRARPARFRCAGSEPRSRGDRRRPQRTDRCRPRSHAALDRRRRTRRPSRTGAHDVGKAADRRRTGPPDRDCRCRRRRSICSRAAARISATPPRSARSRSRRSKARAGRTGASSSLSRRADKRSAFRRVDLERRRRITLRSSALHLIWRVSCPMPDPRRWSAPSGWPRISTTRMSGCSTARTSSRGSPRPRARTTIPATSRGRCFSTSTMSPSPARACRT